MADDSGSGAELLEFDFAPEDLTFIAPHDYQAAEHGASDYAGSTDLGQLPDAVPDFSLLFPTAEAFLSQANNTSRADDSDDEPTLEDALAAAASGQVESVKDGVSQGSHVDTSQSLQHHTTNTRATDFRESATNDISMVELHSAQRGPEPEQPPVDYSAAKTNFELPEWPSIDGIYGDDDDQHDTDSDEEAPKHSKSLRPRGIKFLELDPVDQDESGDFDPDNKAPFPPKPVPSKRTAPIQRRSFDGAQPRKPLQRTSSQLRRVGASYCITFSFPSKKSKKWLRKHRQPDNWPYDQKVEFDQQMDIEEADPDVYDLRERADNAEDEYFLKNHPAARGCKNCLKVHLDCSMLRPDGSYPCEACNEEGEVCEPILTPKRKQACEICVSSREPCTYTQNPGGDHSAPCERCESNGFRCVAGPQYDPMRTRIGDDGKPATPIPRADPVYPRSKKTCAACRRLSRWCSLSNHRTAGEPPCNACRKDRTACTFESAHRERKEPANPGKTRASRKRKLTLAAGTETTITTALAHPITFFVTDDSPFNCHWCTTDNPAYAIFGHGRRTVKVLAWADGQGYDELSGGHTNDGHEPSRMCVSCTQSRVRIAQCAKHELHPIPALPAALDGDIAAREGRPRALVDALMRLAGPPRPAPAALRAEHARWCAVCPAPAQFECGARVAAAGRATADIAALVSREAAPRGCGLRLCLECKELAGNAAFFRGDFQQFLETMQRPPRRAYPRGTRADWDLLRRDGLLMRQHHARLAAKRGA